MDPEINWADCIILSRYLLVGIHSRSLILVVSEDIKAVCEVVSIVEIKETKIMVIRFVVFMTKNKELIRSLTSVRDGPIVAGLNNFCR